MKHLSALNRNKLLVDRAPQLIKCFVKKEEVALESKSGQAVLKIPYSAPSTSVTCSRCQKQTPAHVPRCGYCGDEREFLNSSRSSEAGWQSQGVQQADRFV